METIGHLEVGIGVDAVGIQREGIFEDCPILEPLDRAMVGQTGRQPFTRLTAERPQHNAGGIIGIGGEVRVLKAILRPERCRQILVEVLAEGLIQLVPRRCLVSISLRPTLLLDLRAVRPQPERNFEEHVEQPGETNPPRPRGHSDCQAVEYQSTHSVGYVAAHLMLIARPVHSELRVALECHGRTKQRIAGHSAADQHHGGAIDPQTDGQVLH